jgi:hypothetical protein
MIEERLDSVVARGFLGNGFGLALGNFFFAKLVGILSSH